MNRIKELRKQKKMTQKELANHLQIANSTLSYWETGKYEPDNESLKKLSRFFLVPIDYILGGDFSELRITSEGAYYADVDKQLYTAASASVAEGRMTYSTNPMDRESIHQDKDGIKLSESTDSLTPDAAKTILPNIPDNSVNAQSDFIRSEFEGLTHEEINKLAEYAEFIKSQRMKKLE
jgi:transcriptional regulator with XRE-family HTH domain